MLVLVALITALAPATSSAQDDKSSDAVAPQNREVLIELERRIGLAAPQTDDPQELCIYFHKRGMANSGLGRYDQAIQDLKQALSLNQPNRLSPNNWCDRWRIQNDLNNSYADSGEQLAQIEYLKTIEREYKANNSLLYFHSQMYLIDAYLGIGMLKEGEDVFNRASEFLPQLRMRRDWGNFQHNVMEQYHRRAAWLQELRGNHSEGERFRRAALKNSADYLEYALGRYDKDSQELRIAKRNVAVTTRQLASNLSGHGKLGEAEYLAHEALNQILTYSSFNTTTVSGALAALAHIKLQQSRIPEAARYSELAVRALEGSKVQPYSTSLAGLRSQLGLIRVVQGRWQDALEVFNIRDQGLRTSPEQFTKYGSPNMDWAMALLKKGEIEKATDMMQRLLNFILKKPFVAPVYIAYLRGYLGKALAEGGNNDAALAQFQQAMPELLKQAHDADDSELSAFVRVYRTNVIVEAYLELLAKLQASGQQIADLDVVAEAFKLADVARNSSVQRAVTASAARATLSDLKLSQLARREQDAANRIQALNKILARLASAPEGKQLQKVIGDMRRDIEALTKEQDLLRRELADKFPDYANLVNPQPATPADIQRALLSDESAIAIYTGERQSYVWTITKSDVSYRSIPVSREQVARDVEQLLRSVDLSDGEVREYDTTAAYRIYATLLAPDAAKWSDSKLINVIPHGVLGQIPFAALLTHPSVNKAGNAESTYAEMRWLIGEVAIAQQASVSSFLALRRSPPARKVGKPFIGFGNPLFMAESTPGTQRSKRIRNLGIATAKNESFSIIEQAQLTQRPVNKPAASKRPELAQAFALLPALPDTAEELRDIAQSTGADQVKDVFLWDKATEANIKSIDLSHYRVVAFATHGLIPGEISGLDQPALAMANPRLTNDAENDGFLTLDEVLGLKLNSEWVVLSACNTGSSDGNASEAVSGLGRGFFYAGTRSLLVSYWPVETVSARLLTTGIFRQQANNPAITRSEALRQSMLSVIKTKVDNYSHPAYWAAFSLIGDGDLR